MDVQQHQIRFERGRIWALFLKEFERELPIVRDDHGVQKFCLGKNMLQPDNVGGVILDHKQGEGSTLNWQHLSARETLGIVTRGSAVARGHFRKLAPSPSE